MTKINAFSDRNDKYQSIKLSCKLFCVEKTGLGQPMPRSTADRPIFDLIYRTEKKIKDVLESANPKKSFDNKVARVGWGSCRFQMPQRELRR